MEYNFNLTTEFKVKPIGYKKDSWNVDDTHAFTNQAKGSTSTRGARKDKKRTTRKLKRGDKQKKHYSEFL